jgi:hypothetical protein
MPLSVVPLAELSLKSDGTQKFARFSVDALHAPNTPLTECQYFSREGIEDAQYVLPNLGFQIRQRTLVLF